MVRSLYDIGETLTVDECLTEEFRDMVAEPVGQLPNRLVGPHTGLRLDVLNRLRRMGAYHIQTNLAILPHLVRFGMMGRVGFGLFHKRV